MLVSLLTLTACAHEIPTLATRTEVAAAPAAPPPAPSACTAFPRITFSRLHDTAETVAQIKAYDAGRDVLCGKGK
jgi:hypothetical protein